MSCAFCCEPDPNWTANGLPACDACAELIRMGRIDDLADRVIRSFRAHQLVLQAVSISVSAVLRDRMRVVDGGDIALWVKL